MRYGRWKYVYFADLPPQLFNLQTDPLESRDLAGDPEYRQALKECEAELRKICDPDAMSRLAFADQQDVINRFGGPDAVIKRGTFGHSPVPGEKAVYS